MRWEVLFILFLLLAGCVGQPQKESTTQETSTSTTTTSTTTTQAAILECEDDDCLYDLALESKNFSFCERIKGRVLSTICFAAQRKDEETCTLIGDAALRDKCLYGVALVGLDEDVCENISSGMLEASCLMRLSEGKKDLRLCERIEVATIKEICLRGCVLSLVSGNLSASLEREGYLELVLRAEGCMGLVPEYAIDLEFLRIRSGPGRIRRDNESITYRFRCVEKTDKTPIEVSLGGNIIREYARCFDATQRDICSLSLENTSSLEAYVGEDIRFTFKAIGCKGENLSISYRPDRALEFENSSLEDAVVGSEGEDVGVYFRCERIYDNILIKAEIDGSELKAYASCRSPPTCRLYFLEENSSLEDELKLTAFARDCQGQEVEAASEVRWIEVESVSTEKIIGDREYVFAEFRCKETSEYPRSISLKVGDIEIVKYASCKALMPPISYASS